MVRLAPARAMNVALVEAAGTTTVAGTRSICELLESVTVAPPVPAGWDNTAVHVDAAPELRLVGEHDIATNAAVVPPPEVVASNCTGASPLTSAMTDVTEPAVPAPIVNVTDARP